MMRVANANWRGAADAETAANHYRSAGYRVAVVVHSSERAGSHVVLECTYAPYCPEGDGRC